MEHEGTFLDTVFKLGLREIGINIIFTIIGHVGGALIDRRSADHARNPRDQGGGSLVRSQAVLDAHNTFIIGQLAEKNHLKLLAHIITHPLCKGRKQGGDGGLALGATHSVEGVRFRLIKIGLIVGIGHGAIGAARQGQGSGQRKGSAGLPIHIGIGLQIGDSGHTFLKINLNGSQEGCHIEQRLLFCGVFIRRDNGTKIITTGAGVFGRCVGVSRLHAAGAKAEEMNGFGVKEDFTHRLQFIRRVRIAENFLTVLDKVSLFHRENLAFRPPIHSKGDGDNATVRKGGACLRHRNEVDICTGQNLVLHQEGAAAKGHISSPYLS